MSDETLIKVLMFASAIYSLGEITKHYKAEKTIDRSYKVQAISLLAFSGVFIVVAPIWFGDTALTALLVAIGLLLTMYSGLQVLYICILDFFPTEPPPIVIEELSPPTPKPEKPTRVVFPEIPKSLRLEHTLILGSSGSGKSQLIQTLLAQDLFTPCSVVVFDSQGDLLQEILKVDIPKERIVYLDPTDVDHPIALSFFDFNNGGITNYEREKNFNSVVELLLFVLNSLDSTVTAKQELCLRMLIRFCLIIPNCTIHTLRELLSEQGFKRYSVHLNKVSETAQHFFKDEYLGKSFGETREQISRRVYTILESPLERILGSPKSRVNMKELLDGGSVILVNTAKSFLKEQGSAFFARFITALIFQAVQERDPRRQNTDVFLYIDEAAPVISEQVVTMLETSRKYRMGITLAFQSLSQIPTEFAQSIITNTSVKAVSGVSAKDARALADDMHTIPEILLRTRKLEFFLYIKGMFGITQRIEINELEHAPARTDLRALLQYSRARFSRQEPTKETSPKNIPDSPDNDIDVLNKA